MTARPVEDRGLIHPEECADTCCEKPPAPRRAVATRLIAATVLHRAARAELDAAYDEARAPGVFDTPGVRDIGVVGDEQIGYVLAEEGPWEARIVDHHALRAWTEAEGLTFRQVERALFAVRELGFWLHESTMERGMPPGVERVRSSRPYLRVKPTTDAADTLRAPAPVPAWLAPHLDALHAARGEYDAASDGMRGECRDQALERLWALLDDAPKEA